MVLWSMHVVVGCIGFKRFLWLGRAARYHVGYHVVSRGAGQSRISGHVSGVLETLVG